MKPLVRIGILVHVLTPNDESTSVAHNLAVFCVGPLDIKKRFVAVSFLAGTLL